MDVKIGHCWRCEKPTPAQTHICSHCEIATYCSEKCRQDDQYRHKPECEVWGPKRCNNPTCSETGQLKEASRPILNPSKAKGGKMCPEGQPHFVLTLKGLSVIVIVLG